MALKVGELYGLLRLNTEPFDRGIEKSKAKLHTLGKEYEGMLDRLRSAAVYTAAGLGVIGAAAAYIGVKANSDTEQFLATMTRLTGSTEKARKELEKLKKFAQTTPFDMEDLKKGELIMRAVGLETDKWRQTIGDTAAAWRSAGKTYEDVVQAIADAQTGELERLKEFGITKQQIVEHAEKKLRYTQLVNAKGQITDLEKFNEALLDLMKERYGGMMKVQSETFAGMLSNIQDFGTQALEILSKPIFKHLQAGAKDLMKRLEELQKSGQIEIWAEEAGESIDGLVNILRKIDWQMVGVTAKFVAGASAVLLFARGISNLAMAIRGLFASMGPGGWLIVGLSFLGGIMAAHESQTRKLSIAKTELLMKQIEEQRQLGELAEKYDQLRQKTGLTNDELLRYMDLQKLVSEETDPQKIKEYKDEMSRLQEKSGLTRKEMSELLKLNSRMIEEYPQGTTVISERGSKLAAEAQGYKKLNAEKLESLKLDLESQRISLLAEQPKLLKEIKNAQQEINKIEDQRLKVRQELSWMLEREKKLTEEYRAAEKDNQPTAELDRQLQLLRQHIEMKQEYLNKLGQDKAEQERIINQNNQRLSQLDSLNAKLQQVYQTEIANNNRIIEKNNKKIKQLEDLKNRQGYLTPQQQEQLNKLKAQNEELRSANQKLDSMTSELKRQKGQIDSNTSSARAYNRELGKDITKKILVNVFAKYTGPAANIMSTGVVQALKYTQKRHRGGTISEAYRIPGTGDVPTLLKGGETVLTARHTDKLIRMLESTNTRQPETTSSKPQYEIHIYGMNDPMLAADETMRRIRQHEWLMGAM